MNIKTPANTALSAFKRPVVTFESCRPDIKKALISLKMQILAEGLKMWLHLRHNFNPSLLC